MTGHKFKPYADMPDYCVAELDSGDTCNRPREDHQRAWTFFGHWEDDALVFEYVLEGVHEDRRIDTGYWEQGLFAAEGYGLTVAEAELAVRLEYESDYRCDYCDRPEFECSVNPCAGVIADRGEASHD